MNFSTIASGSSGNAYVLEAEGHKVLLELGVPWKKILLHLGFMTSNVDFAYGSHRHFDHLAKNTVRDALKSGIDTYMPGDAAESLQVASHHRVHILIPGEKQSIGPWTILPFSCKHDVETIGLIIRNGGDQLLFVPDTEYIEPRFTKGITILCVECNHASDLLSANILNGNLHPAVGQRIRRTHLELQTVKDFIIANKMTETLRKIYLMHLSNLSSSEERFKREIEEITAVPVEIC